MYNSVVYCPIVLIFSRLIHGPRGRSRERLEGRAASSGNAALIVTFSGYYHYHPSSSSCYSSSSSSSSSSSRKIIRRPLQSLRGAVECNVSRLHIKNNSNMLKATKEV